MSPVASRKLFHLTHVPVSSFGRRWSGVPDRADMACALQLVLSLLFNSDSTCVASFVLIVRYSSSLSPPRACKSLNFASISLALGWSSSALPRNLLTTAAASASRTNITANQNAARNNGCRTKSLMNASSGPRNVLPLCPHYPINTLCAGGKNRSRTEGEPGVGSQEPGKRPRFDFFLTSDS